MSDGFACLVIADESPEFPAALAYAAHLAVRGAWRLVMLRVIEPSEPAPWVGVGDEMKRQALAAADSLLERFAAEAWAEAGAKGEAVVREGDLRTELRRLIESDAAIKLLVLAAGAGPGGPGPLVSAVAKGQVTGARPIPVIVVPGGLTKPEIAALIAPAIGAPG